MGFGKKSSPAPAPQPTGPVVTNTKIEPDERGDGRPGVRKVNRFRTNERAEANLIGSETGGDGDPMGGRKRVQPRSRAAYVG